MFYYDGDSYSIIMTDVVLVYPYFRPRYDTSIFRFPPLGLGYILSFLRQNGISAGLVDCTFLNQEEALKKIIELKPRIVGIQSMYSMKGKSIELAQQLRNQCELLVAGGALPTLEPEEFLNSFDVVVIGEGEITMLELAKKFLAHQKLTSIKGIAYKENNKIAMSPCRELIENIDKLPYPARDLFDDSKYKEYYYRKFGYKTTPLMTSRGCPFSCDFCSKPVFKDSFRMRTAENIVNEIEEVIDRGYDRLWIADDCFTLNSKRLIEICDEIIRRKLSINWECLSRVDTINLETILKMKKAGCIRMFFGIESGNDSVLKIMKKQITTKQAAHAVKLCKNAGIESGAFFILGYPGEDKKTILETVKFASSLPLNYLSFTLPYPIPGTPLHDRLNHDIISKDWNEPKNIQLIKHNLLFSCGISENKLKMAIAKGMVQFYIRKYFGNRGYRFIGMPFEVLSDFIMIQF